MSSLTAAAAGAAASHATEPLPVTERENELTRGLDAASPLGVVRLLRQTDAQIFTGYLDYPCLADDSVRQKIVRCVGIVADVLTRYRTAIKDPNPVASGVPRIIMSGSGTSGRLGFLVAREMNRVVASLNDNDAGRTATLELTAATTATTPPPPFGYCVSGGDPALLLSDELPEDDPVTGAADWLRETGRAAEEGGTRAANGSCLIGITCGLSAPYVAGQVDHILDVADAHDPRDGATDSAILMGFNPAALARDKPIEIWKARRGSGRSTTVRDVVTRLVAAEGHETGRAPGSGGPENAAPGGGGAAAYPSSFCLLNPVVGPEPVCASSRMKGGTCTKILLDVVLAIAVARVYGLPLLHWSAADATSSSPTVRAQVDAVLDAFASAYARTYSSSAPAIARLLARCGASLRGGRGRADGGGGQEAGQEGEKASADAAGAAALAANMTGHVYWSGAGAAGILAAIDASEMPDTYGAAFDETRAFVFGGWHGVGTTQSDPHILSQEHPLLRISYTDFVEDVLGGEVGRIRNVPTPQLLRFRPGGNTLTRYDTLIDVCDVWPMCDDDGDKSAASSVDGGGLARRGVTDGILGADASMPLTMCVDPSTFSSAQRDCAWRKARVGFSYLDCEEAARARDDDTYGGLSVQLPRPAAREWLLPGRYCGLDTLMLKLVLNAVSTGAQVMKGMVYQNHMINVGPTNAKIFDRCVRLISRFAGVELAAAHTALLRAVYEEDVDLASGASGGDGEAPPAEIAATPALLSSRVIGTAEAPRTQSDHIKQFTPPPAPGERQDYAPAKSVLPLAIVLAAKGVRCTCREGKQVLERNPLVRAAIEEATGIR